jgi:urease accessory protein
MVINTIDLAPAVGADLEVIRRDAEKMRSGRLSVFTKLKTSEGIVEIIARIKRDMLFITH